MTLICIDGPSGAGKSTAGVWLAHRLGLRYLETGYFYRGLAIAGLGQAQLLADPAGALGRVELEVRVPPDADWRPTLRVDGTDVTSQLRDPAVDDAVAAVAADRASRDAIAARNRSIAAPGSIVVVGRATASELGLTAHLALAFTAEPEVRARRRAAADGVAPVVSPARDAPTSSAVAGALDTSTMTIEQMRARVLAAVHATGIDTGAS